MPKIIVDYENNAEDWWTAAREAFVFEEPIRALAKDGEVIVDQEQADQFLSWARSLPGWNGGPKHAPHPLLVQE